MSLHNCKIYDLTHLHFIQNCLADYVRIFFSLVYQNSYIAAIAIQKNHKRPENNISVVFTWRNWNSGWSLLNDEHFSFQAFNFIDGEIVFLQSCKRRIVERDVRVVKTLHWLASNDSLCMLWYDYTKQTVTEWAQAQRSELRSQSTFKDLFTLGPDFQVCVWVINLVFLRL